MEIDRIDEILTLLKSFKTHITNIIDNGYSNDINDLEYLHDIIDAYYNPSPKDDASSISSIHTEELYKFDFIDSDNEEKKKTYEQRINELFGENNSDSEDEPPKYFFPADDDVKFEITPTVEIKPEQTLQDKCSMDINDYFENKDYSLLINKDSNTERYNKFMNSWNIY